MRTAGAPARLEAAADRAAIRADGRDLAFITVRVTDDHGTTVPRATNRIHFKIDGPGEIVATDNGDPTSFEPFQSPQRNAFHGLALAIVRAKPGQPGVITLSADSEGLQSAAVAVRAD
jgi:beta-galactosidase